MVVEMLVEGERGGGQLGRIQPPAAMTNAISAPRSTDNDNDTTRQSTPTTISELSFDEMQRLVSFFDSSPASDKLSGKNTTHTWLLNTGASHHMAGTLDHLFDRVDLFPSPVSLPNGVQANATLQGSVRLSSGLTLQKVLYVPNLKCNLISIGQFIFIILV